MYAVVNIAGSQFKVRKDDTIYAPKVKGEVGKEVQFDEVLFISDKGKVSVGQPTVKGALVKAEITGFGKGKKVIVFKKKRRKGYRVKNGHRQEYAALRIKAIQAKPAKKADSAKKVDPVKKEDKE